MNNNSSQIFRFQFSGKTSYFNKSESHKSKPWFVNFITVPCKGVHELTFCSSKVCCIEFSVFIKYFCVSDCYNSSFGSLYLQSDPANHILAHVGNEAAFGSSEYLYRFYFLNFPYCRPLSGNKVEFVICSCYRNPFAFVITWLAPSCQFLRGIVCFTIIYIIHSYGSVLVCFPGVI